MDKGHKGPHRIGNDLKCFHRPLVTVRPHRRVPEAFQQRGEITGDERIHLTCFVLYFYLFFSSYLLSGGQMKRRNYTQMGLLSICFAQVLARYDFKGHQSALKCCLKRDTCFFFLFCFFFSCCNNCSAHWYLTPRWMTHSDSVNTTIG